MRAISNEMKLLKKYINSEEGSTILLAHSPHNIFKKKLKSKIIILTCSGLKNTVYFVFKRNIPLKSSFQIELRCTTGSSSRVIKI